ncbi:hypothetical protein CHGG_09578 [Chaetomium globosum CBS 148.51]|uniref:molybdopterin adenylyltransferase n=1 Tax=Chaetomium globosum (strain ATCC 6205 / CBS 148.51 / DSM 1962 / NBRC 6347 / NRRL 1970) TaxID=306901 RepID=Q2GR26_CHAGB|nr:uncharacterized protein CHGG_09578 [Chaetomium globosum CBS 148.51]EAQ85564.1 hypothetical protein CHGG_09578 [Chaetomium globosum CBS 148.51]
MTPSYGAGLDMVLDIARGQRKFRQSRRNDTLLHDAVGGTVAEDVASPKSSPEYDTSAMDGYAICSRATTDATPGTPIMLAVQGTLAAGDDPAEAFTVVERSQTTNNQCFEIMTGAIFPPGYDACVKVEDTVPVDGTEVKSILVTRPVPLNAHRRLAGSDIAKGDIIIHRGDILQPSHILPLASVGIKSIPLTASPRAAIWSTGKEIVIGTGATGDTNGPYLTAALKEMGLQPEFLGVLDDDKHSLQKHIQSVAAAGSFDVIITSGAVSRGKFDHIRAVLEQIGSTIVFHGLRVRPGHPVLFAVIPGPNGRTPFFGLPGNPGAAAACFRFLVAPYLRTLQGRAKEQPIMARLSTATIDVRTQARLFRYTKHRLFPPRSVINLCYRPTDRQIKRRPKPSQSRPLRYDELLDPFTPQ